jgi:hypothetical protein
VNVVVQFPTLATLATGASPPDGETVRTIASSIRQTVFSVEYESHVNQATFNGEVLSLLGRMYAELVPANSLSPATLAELDRVAALATAAADRARANTIDENATSTGLFDAANARAADRMANNSARMDELRANFSRITTDTQALNRNNSNIVTTLQNITSQAAVLTNIIYVLSNDTVNNMTALGLLWIDALNQIVEGSKRNGFNLDLTGIGNSLANAILGVPGFIGDLVKAVLDQVPSLDDLFGFAVDVVIIVAMAASGAAILLSLYTYKKLDDMQKYGGMRSR